MVKIVFVSEFGEKTSNSTGLFVNQIYAAVRAQGHDTHLITSDDAQSIDEGRRSVVKLPLKRFMRRMRPVYWLLVSVQLALCAYKRSCRGDVIVVASNPIFLPLIIKLLALFNGGRVSVLLLFDAFPLNAIATNKIKSKSLVARAVELLFQRVYLFFDAIIVNGRDCVEVINQWQPKGGGKVVYAPHFLLEEHFTRRGKEASTTSDVADVRLQYLGNVGPMQGLDMFMPTLINLLSESDRLQLATFGNVIPASELHALGESVSQRIKSYPEVAFKNRHSALSKAEYGLVTLAPGMYGLAVPSKAWFALAAGQGLIVFGDKGSELDLILSQYPCLGVFVPSNQLEGAASKIMSFIDNDQLNSDVRQSSGLKFLQNCERDAVGAYASLFDDLTSTNFSDRYRS